MQQKTVTLAFTDKPIPPPSSADAKPAKSSPKSNPARALWDAIQKVLDPSDDESNPESE